MDISAVTRRVRSARTGLRRVTVILALWLVASGQASAQTIPVIPTTASEAETDCQPVSPTSEVVVSTSGGQTIRGTLMCLSEDEAWLLRDGRLSKLPLPDVRRIRTPADPVWDGAATGAVIPLIFWALLCHECQAEPMLKAALTYGMIGLATDAIQSNRRTLYRGGGRSLSVGWGFSF